MKYLVQASALTPSNQANIHVKNMTFSGIKRQKKEIEHNKFKKLNSLKLFPKVNPLFMAL